MMTTSDTKDSGTAEVRMGTKTNAGRKNSVPANFLDGGIIALYARRSDGSGQMVAALNLSAPLMESDEIKTIAIFALQKQDRVLRGFEQTTRFVHFDGDVIAPQILLDFDQILQTTPYFWDCECAASDYIHESSKRRNSVCRECAAAEGECADAQVDEVCRAFRGNFKRGRLISVWRRDTQSGERKFYLGGFPNRRAAEDAITDFHYLTNRFEETVGADYSINYNSSRNFISAQMWEIKEGKV